MEFTKEQIDFLIEKIKSQMGVICIPENYRNEILGPVFCKARISAFSEIKYYLSSLAEKEEV